MQATTKIHFFIFSPHTAYTKGGSHTMNLLHLSDHQTYRQQKCETSWRWPLTCEECTQQQGKEEHGIQGKKKQSHPTIAARALHPFSQGSLFHSYNAVWKTGETGKLCSVLTGGGHSPGWKAWRLSEIQCSSKKLLQLSHLPPSRLTSINQKWKR